MESNIARIDIIYGKCRVTLSWNEAQTSEDMVIDNIDEIGSRFLRTFKGSFIQFLDGDGMPLSISSIVTYKVSPIFAEVPDASINIESYKPTRILEGLKFTLEEDLEIKSDGKLENAPSKVELGKDNTAPFAELEKKPSNEMRSVTMQEVAQHNKAGDCWMVLQGKVFDVTDYVKRHPGGKVILKAAGKDGTALFNKYHPWVNFSFLLKGYQVGTLSKS